MGGCRIRLVFQRKHIFLLPFFSLHGFTVKLVVLGPHLFVSLATPVSCSLCAIPQCNMYLPSPMLCIPNNGNSVITAFRNNGQCHDATCTIVLRVKKEVQAIFAVSCCYNNSHSNFRGAVPNQFLFRETWSCLIVGVPQWKSICQFFFQ